MSYLKCLFVSVVALAMLTLIYAALILWFLSGISGGAADHG